MNWPILAGDVDRQERGEQPLKMHTQFQRRLLAAETKIENDHEDLVNDIENFAKAPEDFIPDYWFKVAWEMRNYYSESEIKKYGYSAWDVMNEYVDQLISEISR